MAQVTTVDVTTMEGNNVFPLNTNDVMDLVEKLAVQNIENVKSANRIYDGAFNYEIDGNGKVIEEALIAKATARAFNKSAANFTPVDPTLYVKYFNNYEAKQFAATIRRDDIRAVLAQNKSVDELVTKVLDTLTQGESKYDFEQLRNVIYSAAFKDFSTTRLANAEPLNMKGVIYCIREMYNALICDNSDLTGTAFESSTAPSDVRIAIAPQVLNLIDVTELANIFNLSKEELMGKIVVVANDDLSADDNENANVVYVYDVHAIGRATRVYDYTQDAIGSARYTNHYLTVERAYFHNSLYKGVKLDCTAAVTAAKATLIG